jgi:hypothetical protein
MERCPWSWNVSFKRFSLLLSRPSYSQLCSLLLHALVGDQITIDHPGPKPNVIKRFKSVERLSACPWQILQPSLMSANQAGAHQQTLDLAGKACKRSVLNTVQKRVR